MRYAGSGRRGFALRWRVLPAAVFAAILSVIGAVLTPSSALAAPMTHQMNVPAAAVTAWVDLEQAGIVPAQLVVEQRAAAGGWATVPLTGTTFGLHGEFPVAPGAYELRLTPSADLSPDLAITFLDGAGGVVGELSLRLDLRSGSGVSGPAQQPLDREALGLTGSSGFPYLIVAAAVLLLAGGAVIGWRVLRARRARLDQGAVASAASGDSGIGGDAS